MNETILQIFLGFNLLLLGGMISFVIQYFLANRRESNASKPAPTQTISPVAMVPRAVRSQIAEEAAAQIKNVLKNSSENLENDLSNTSTQLNSLLKKIGSSILDDEMKLFREHLQMIRRQTESAVGTATLEVGDQQVEIEAKLAERQSQFEAKLIQLQAELEQALTIKQTKLNDALDERRQQLIDKLDIEFIAERDRLHAQIDTKLGDAVATFLTESLQHNIDLGSQTEYLSSLLEQHKADLRTAASGESMLLDDSKPPVIEPSLKEAS